MTTRLYIIALGLALLVGVGLGYWLHGSPAPAPTVTAAEAVARGRVADARQAVTIAKPANDTALHAIARYHTARQRDTVVVDSVVYVAAAPADSAVRACSDAIPKDTTALAKQDTAVAALHTVIRAQDAERFARLGGALTGLYDPRAHAGVARAETVIRMTQRWAVVGEAERGTLPRDSLQLRVGARWSF